MREPNSAWFRPRLARRRRMALAQGNMEGRCFSDMASNCLQDPIYAGVLSKASGDSPRQCPQHSAYNPHKDVERRRDLLTSTIPGVTFPTNRNR
jgi:hypothetical protein